MDELPRYLIAIAEEGSINKAASRIHISQPALSQRLHQLEAQLGTPLFERVRNTMVPTHAGKVYLEWARCSTMSEDCMLRDIADIACGHKRRMTIGVSLPRCRTILPQVVRRFYDEVDGCTLSFEEAGTTQKVNTLLADDVIDFAVLTPVPASFGLYSAERFCGEQLVLVAPASMEIPVLERASPFPTVDPREVERLPFIMPPRSHHLNWVVRTMMDQVDVHISIVMTSCETPFTLAVVREGVGVSIVPHTFLPPNERAISCYLLDGLSTTSYLWLSYRRHWTPSADARAFLSILRQVVNKDPLLRLAPEG